MPTRKALITGITGQDGSYLAEFLLSKDYEVFGLVRRSSSPSNERIRHILDKVTLLEGDLQDLSSLIAAMKVQPDEVYNLAAMSFVPTSHKEPFLTADVTGVGAVRVLEAIRLICPGAKFYQASSSEMYGWVREVPQTELTPFYPRSPYAAAKSYAHQMTVNYREAHGLFAVSGILFNHESPRRGLEFVTRKITDGVARIKLGLSDTLRLGNIEARRDWGFAGDYVEAMWLMLQQDEPDDYVIATGFSHSVLEFVEGAFSSVGLNYLKHLNLDSTLLRRTEVDELLGDAKKARAKLGWQPKVSFTQLIEMMVQADIKRLTHEHYRTERKSLLPNAPDSGNGKGDYPGIPEQRYQNTLSFSDWR